MKRQTNRGQREIEEQKKDLENAKKIIIEFKCYNFKLGSGCNLSKT